MKPQFYKKIPFRTALQAASASYFSDPYQETSKSQSTAFTAAAPVSFPNLRFQESISEARIYSAQSQYLHSLCQTENTNSNLNTLFKNGNQWPSSGSILSHYMGLAVPVYQDGLAKEPEHLGSDSHSHELVGEPKSFPPHDDFDDSDLGLSELFKQPAAATPVQYSQPSSPLSVSSSQPSIIFEEEDDDTTEHNDDTHFPSHDSTFDSAPGSIRTETDSMKSPSHSKSDDSTRHLPHIEPHDDELVPHPHLYSPDPVLLSHSAPTSTVSQQAPTFEERFHRYMQKYVSDPQSSIQPSSHTLTGTQEQSYSTQTPPPRHISLSHKPHSLVLTPALDPQSAIRDKQIIKRDHQALAGLSSLFKKPKVTICSDLQGENYENMKTFVLELFAENPNIKIMMKVPERSHHEHRAGIEQSQRLFMMELCENLSREIPGIEQKILCATPPSSHRPH